MRAGSGRNPRELRCQSNFPTCPSSLISPHPFPKFWETELQTLMGASAQNPLPLPPPALAAFRACHEQNDVVSFIVLASEYMVGVSPLPGLTAGAPGAAPATELLSPGWPFCEACLERLVTDLSRRADNARLRADRAEHCVRALGGVSGGGGGDGAADADAAAAALAGALDAEEAALLAALAAAEERRARAARARAALAARRARLASQHATLWAVHREVSRRLWAGREAMGALCARAERLRASLSRLRCLRVRSDAFFIWHEEPYATINRARLGRATGRVPEWSEINAALGQLALLLTITASSFKGGAGGRPAFQFKKWFIVPCGSFSEITEKGRSGGGAERHPLYFNSGAWSLVGASPASKLGSALQKLMQCLHELGAYVQQLDPAFKLPYDVSPGGDRVGGLPVAPVGSEPWTRAMRYAACDVKWLVAKSFDLHR